MPRTEHAAQRPDERDYYPYYHHDQRQTNVDNEIWLELDSDSQTAADLRMDPGSQMEASLLHFDRSSGDYKKITTKRVTVCDPHKQTFGLKGDRVRAVLNQERQEYEVKGSFGLRRKAKVTESGGILAGQSGEVTFYHAGMLTSPAQTVEAFNDFAGAADLDENDDTYVTYWPDEEIWTVDTNQSGTSTGSQIVILKCDAGNALLPGVTTGKTFSEYTWSGSALVDTGTNRTTVKDPLNCNCYVPGEYGLFRKDGADYYPVGSHGLVRFAKADATINIDAEASGKLYENGTLATAIQIANTYEGFKRALISGLSDDCCVIYDTTQSKWIALPPWVAVLARGTTDGVLTPGGTVPAIDGWQLLDLREPDGNHGTAPASGSWNNRYDLAGVDNTQMFFSRDVSTAADTDWIGVQAELVKVSAAKDLRIDPSSPYKFQNLYQDVWGHIDVENIATWTDEITTCPP